MKPISLAYLRENLPKVTSRLGLIRLFTDSGADNNHLNRWLIRTVRSAEHPRSHENLENHDHNERGGSSHDFPGSDGKYDRSTELRDEFPSGYATPLDTSNGEERAAYKVVEDFVDVKDDEGVDYQDYSQDEHSEDKLEGKMPFICLSFCLFYTCLSVCLLFFFFCSYFAPSVDFFLSCSIILHDCTIVIIICW